jgi:hypothetical protein
MNFENTDLPGEQRKVRREAAKKEMVRTEITGWMQPTSAGKIIQTDYHDDLALLKMLAAVAKKLATSNEDPTIETIDHKGTVVSLPTPTGAALIAICRVFDPDFPARHRHHEFNPWIKAIVVAIRNWGLQSGIGSQFPVMGIAPVDRHNLGRIACFVRLVSQSPGFKRKLSKDKAVASQDYLSASMYMTALFRLYACLLVVRINLYFWCEGSDEMRSEKAQAVFHRFLPMLRSGRIETQLVGCLASHGEGAERGIHFQVLVALDGQICKDASGYAKAIGKRWETECHSTGRSSFYNSYAGRDKHKFSGIGLVHVGDRNKLIALREVLLSLAKSTYLVKLKYRPKKCFCRGSIQRINGRLSASRQPGHDMATVLQILAA